LPAIVPKFDGAGRRVRQIAAADQRHGAGDAAAVDEAARVGQDPAAGDRYRSGVGQRAGVDQRSGISQRQTAGKRVVAGEHPGSPDPGQGADARRRGELERVGPAAARNGALDQEGAGNQLQEVVTGGDRRAAAADDRAAVEV
jgi:hypothetical protein